jgi:hypothetical protein
MVARNGDFEVATGYQTLEVVACHIGVDPKGISDVSHRATGVFGHMQEDGSPGWVPKGGSQGPDFSGETLTPAEL